MGYAATVAATVQRFEDAAWHARLGRPGSPPSFDPRHCSPDEGGFAVVLEAQSDETLAVAIQSGLASAAAFAELFVRRYSKLLRYWFHQRGADLHTAQDLAQEVVMKMFENGFSGYDPLRSSFRAYLRAVATNHSISRARKKVPQTDSDSRGVEAVGPDVTLQELYTRDDHRRAAELVDRLPEPQRTVFLRKVEGVPVAEIADQVGVPVPKVYKLYYTAQLSLRRAFGDTDGQM